MFLKERKCFFMCSGSSAYDSNSNSHLSFEATVRFLLSFHAKMAPALRYSCLAIIRPCLYSLLPENTANTVHCLSVENEVAEGIWCHREALTCLDFGNMSRYEAIATLVMLTYGEMLTTSCGQTTRTVATKSWKQRHGRT
jgi:hypothetical protein